VAALFILSAAFAMAPAAAAAAPRLLVARAPAATFDQPPAAGRTVVRRARQLVQEDDDNDAEGSTADKGVAPAQIEKYVAVYRAMQRDHNLTIEKAVAAQGLTVHDFRDLESRIESDDLARDDARNALAAPSSDAAQQQNARIATLSRRARASALKTTEEDRGPPPHAQSGRYFVTEDAKAASSRATASLARLTESSAPAAASSAVFADCAAVLPEFCALLDAVEACCALDSACEVAWSI
jgi:hypothetical protein